MIPKSLAVGNILTLIEAQYGDENNQGVIVWSPMPHHKGLNRPRAVVSNRSKFAEIGEELSRLDYPTKSEFTETDDTLTLTYLEKGTPGAPRGGGTKLVYKVQRPAKPEPEPTKYVYAKGGVQDGVVVRRSSFTGVGCDAEIMANAEEGFRLVSMPPIGRAVILPHDAARASELCVELTEAIRQAIHRSGL
jgi:hypothetical protein